MRRKVSEIVQKVIRMINVWEDVSVVTLMSFAEHEVDHPNFSISLDVYYRGKIMDMEKRAELFREIQFIESSELNFRDRFIMDSLPVRVSYKSVSRIEALIESVKGEGWLSIERGTYVFYRLCTGSIEFFRDDWIQNIRTHLDDLSVSFWRFWLESCKTRLSHLLGDMNAAVMNGDEHYFRQSLGNFMSVTAQAIFALNRTFEPGPRDVSAELDLMEEYPDGFWANWKSLLREDKLLTAERKCHIADIVFRSLLRMDVAE